MKWLRYQRVISLKIQVGNTNQRNKWANTNPRIYRRWDQVPRRSKHPLLIDHTRREPSSMIMNAELSAVKVPLKNFFSDIRSSWLYTGTILRPAQEFITWKLNGDVTIAREGLQNLDMCPVLGAFEQGEIDLYLDRMLYRYSDNALRTRWGPADDDVPRHS
jgi:hypothetical protein